MSLIPEQQLNEIKSKVDIVTLIGEQIPLKRAGQNWRGHCPFHQEKTPSFMVSPEKQIYHCFGCGEGGNLFNFLMKFEGLNFVEAAEKLADRAGIHLQRQEGAPRVSGEEKEMLFRINRFAARVFAQNLQDPEKGKRGQKYLVSRGVLPETIQKYELGLALPGYENLAGRLEGKKIPPTYAEKVGLIRQKENRYYDFFRDRLIFPIVAASGQVIGFGGRILEDEPGQAKYINSSDSMIYNKSESVFGLNLAKQAIRQQDAVILVEGYLDQIILHQAGFENVVAPLGTALTEAQIRTLSRFTKNFILLLDGDEAGQKACRRALPLFLKQGIFAKTVVLPPEADPDSFVREKGKEALASLLKEAVPLFDSFMQSVMVGVESNTQGKMKAVQTIFPVLQLLTAGIEKDLYVQRVASFLHLSEGEVRKELNLFEKKGATFHPLSADGEQEAAFVPAVELKNLPTLERSILQLVLSGHLIPLSFFEKVEESDFSHPSLQELWRVVQQVGGREGRVLIASLLDQLTEESLRQLAVTLAMENQLASDDVELAFKDVERQVRRLRLQRELQLLTQEIRLAEEKHDEPRVVTLVGLKNKLIQNKVLEEQERAKL